MGQFRTVNNPSAGAFGKEEPVRSADGAAVMAGTKSTLIFGAPNIIDNTSVEVETGRPKERETIFTSTKSAPIFTPDNLPLAVERFQLNQPAPKPEPLPMYRPWSVASKYIMSLPYDYLTTAPVDPPAASGQNVNSPPPPVSKATLPLVSSKSMVPVFSAQPAPKEEKPR
jgi:hypothetical protein